MSYKTYDQGVETASPIELHEFKYGPRYFRYVNDEQDYVDELGRVWSKAGISVTNFTEDATEGRGDVTVSCPIDLPALQPFREGVPYMEYRNYQFHDGDPDEERYQWFHGRVTNLVQRPDEFTAELTGSSYINTLEEPILRKKCQVACPHGVYSDDCKAVANDFRINTQVVSITGSLLVLVDKDGLGGKAADYYPGGYMSWLHEDFGAEETRLIKSWDPATLTIQLVSPPSGLSAGATVGFFPGCPHTLQACDERFNNAENYGGAPFIPTESPFGGTTLF